ncbi:hypothetical protein [Natrinema sp. HArc-T2]|uniref:hypothetical protein n=1 Tax=Natrinema sp. HArc-T2 TaxID=3242701 RepID=UPI00359D1ED5
MKRRQLVSGASLAAIATLAGCTGGSGTTGTESSKPPIDQLEISIFDVRQPDLGVQSATLPVILEFTNPADVEIPSPSGEFDVAINGYLVVTAEPTLNTLEPGETAKTTLELIIEYVDSRSAAVDALRSKSFQLTMDGKLRSEDATETVSLSYDYGQ